ncbi:MAG: hypothetical protein ACFFFT_02440 [Candidatus Thorarchaeota archaeon]
MRNKIIYIYTENLNFFYRLNRELNRLNIKFKILSGSAKVPDISSLLLTTYNELDKFSGKYKKLKILSYNKEKNFNHYILKILAAYRLNYKENYTDLLFSIDPGSKKIGLVVFLEDYYLNSHTFYDEKVIIDVIKDYIDCFQNDNADPLQLTFKFGSGVLTITSRLIHRILDIFQERNRIKIYLINESKSSKIKIQNTKKRFRTKHELSALILALRSGIEVDREEFLDSFKHGKNLNLNNRRENEILLKEVNVLSIDVKDIIEKIITNEISLSQSTNMIIELKKINKEDT